MSVTVKQTAEGKWAVQDAGEVLAEFETSAAAWRWLDHRERRQLWARGSSAERLGAVYYHVPDSNQ